LEQYPSACIVVFRVGISNTLVWPHHFSTRFKTVKRI